MIPAIHHARGPMEQEFFGNEADARTCRATHWQRKRCAEIVVRERAHETIYCVKSWIELDDKAL